MSKPSLEQRVEALEKQVAALQANGTKEKPRIPPMGVLAGDKIMKEIFDEALKYREKDRDKARRRYAKKAAKPVGTKK